MRDARIREHPLPRLRHTDPGPRDHRRHGSTRSPAGRSEARQRSQKDAGEVRQRPPLYTSRHESGDRRRRTLVRVGRHI